VDGTLLYRAGNPAIHVWSRTFLERVCRGADRLKYHLARKKVPYYDPATGETITPTEPNAIKFELFVFDALPLAERWSALQTIREDEFAPLKNATGADSVATAQALLTARNQRWLQAAGCSIPGDRPVEISPFLALDAAELAKRWQKGIYFGPC
jgi:UDP-N-acetylglucosamine/UDP-N-acetylgalactosamine diphosphorylase